MALTRTGWPSVRLLQYLAAVALLMGAVAHTMAEPLVKSATLRKSPAVPETPVAFQPFRVEVSTIRWDRGTLLDLNVADHVITIVHQTNAGLYYAAPSGKPMFVKIPGLPAGDYSIINKELNPDGFLHVSNPVKMTIEKEPPTQTVSTFLYSKAWPLFYDGF